jgi:hypothetical protein
VVNSVILLEWTCDPRDFFEEPFEFETLGASVRIQDGSIQARIPEENYPPDHSLRTQLQHDVEIRFLAAQVVGHRRFNLSQSQVSREHADGRRDVWLFPETVSFTFGGPGVDYVIRDAEGNVVHDTRVERIKNKRSLANWASVLATSHPAVETLLRFYAGAINDPANELIYLYEIRDAVSRIFGGDRSARAKLGISVKRWRRLGELANELPLAEGRHRGKSLGKTREATYGELSEAREIAQLIIRSYLQYLGANL